MKIFRNQKLDVRSKTEKWLRSQGLPHLIEDYNAKSDILTRTTPFLALVFLSEISFAFGDRFSGWAQSGVVVLFMIIFLGAAVLVNWLRGRRLIQLPDDIGYLELLLFIFLPALPVLLTTTDGLLETFVAVVVANVLLLLLAYLVTSYGILPMTIWAFKFMMHQLGQMKRLIARSLPLLLLFSAFFFLNSEMWQVAADFTVPFYFIIIALIFLGGCGFLISRLPEEVVSLDRFDSWESVKESASEIKSPLLDEPVTQELGEFRAIPISKAAKRNIQILLFFTQIVRFMLSGIVMGLFFVIFGLLAVRRNTIDHWLPSRGFSEIASWELFGAEMLLTWELLAVASFIAAFAGLQFAVSTLIDATYRENFFNDITQRLRQVLAVRRLYLELPENTRGEE